MRNAHARIAATALLVGGFLALGAGSAAADTDPNFEPGPDYSNFEPGPDYTNFEPGPDYAPFEPGYAPGSADLVDDAVGPVVGRLLGGLFR